jgi:lipopolysaccharide/colanic/teichoic acid biosynthesis glycosyltransferase
MPQTTPGGSPALRPLGGAAGSGGGDPTLWGLTPLQLHDRFWAARGVEVVRQGERSEIVRGAELFLLTDPRTLVIFRLRDLVGMLSWLKPEILFVRLTSSRQRGYRETVLAEPSGRFQRFERTYDASETHLTRLALTRDETLARAFQTASSTGEGWRAVRRIVARRGRAAARVAGKIYDRSKPADTAQFVRDLIGYWRSPSASIPRARSVAALAWGDQDAQIDRGARFVGPVWVGAGRHVGPDTPVVGPAALWDDPACRPEITGIQWLEIEPTEAFNRHPRANLSSFDRAAKRVFDVLFALVVLACTLPLYPLIMLAIWVEDGRPFFFAHTRETRGGSEFGCLKFRSMRRDAEQIKLQMRTQNQADGPQFRFEDDPRLTRVGRFLRASNLDELPQFLNVLRGDMSVVGPRPSPRAENQYCPPWREARLSVRPGITGLWQVKRTRRRGLDFQEWIRYDIQYVENMSFWLDISIIWQTLVVLFRGMIRR